jgi:hypothetical protein
MAERQELIDREYSRVKREMMEQGLRSDEAADYAMEAANALASRLGPDEDEALESLNRQLKYQWEMSGSRQKYEKFRVDPEQVATALEMEMMFTWKEEHERPQLVKKWVQKLKETPAE